MLTAGLDLAAEPEKTALAVIDWSTGTSQVAEVHRGVRDGQVIDVASRCEKLGIDCPLGWPVPFVEFISSHQNGHVVLPPDVQGLDWRRRLAFRRTDAAVRVRTEQKLIPLSVAADRIGHTAMRCAGLLAELASRGTLVDRAGTGLVVEVYPAASLWSWKLPYRRYKGSANSSVRHALVGALMRRAPWLDFGRHLDVCRDDDDALDAVLAAMTARAAYLGLATRPSEDDRELAAVEGWIAVPTGELSELAPT